MSAFGNYRTHPGIELNRPKDGPAFERLCEELFRSILDDRDTQVHARDGQAQDGVDIYGWDRETNKLVGVQCKKRGLRGRFTVDHLDAAVGHARAFEPPLDLFIVTLSSDTDRRLQKRARELSDKRLRVEVHGWDWIERVIPDALALAHGLRATAQPDPPRLTIDQQIGARLRDAIDRMNVRRSADEMMTLPWLARFLGEPDWRRLERICDGTEPLSQQGMVDLANRLGLNADWLIEGKGTPFAVELVTGDDAEGIFNQIVAMKPEQVVIVRQRGLAHDRLSNDAMICVQRDAVRWVSLDGAWPIRTQIGSGGRCDLVAFWALLGVLIHHYERNLVLHSVHLEDDLYWAISGGETHAGGAFAWSHDDNWALLLHKFLSKPLHSHLHWEASLGAVIEILPTLVDHARARGAAAEVRALKWSERAVVQPVEDELGGDVADH